MNISSFSQLIFFSSITIFALSLIWILAKRFSFSFPSFKGKKHSTEKLKYINKDDVLYNALIVYPELEDYLYYLGLKSIKNPIVKKTFAKKTTFEKVAKSLGKDVDSFLEEINEYIEENVNGPSKFL